MGNTKIPNFVDHNTISHFWLHTTANQMQAELLDNSNVKTSRWEIITSSNGSYTHT